MKLKNISKGPRIIQMSDDLPAVFIMPGETKTVDGSKIRRGLPDGVVVDYNDVPAAIPSRRRAQPIAHDDDDELEPAPPELVEKASADLRQLDHDGDGKPGGSLPHNPPALSGMTKAELLAQAKAEGVKASQIMNKAAIIAAIENKRTVE